jgi:hypothetical protein
MKALSTAMKNLKQTYNTRLATKLRVLLSFVAAFTISSAMAEDGFVEEFIADPLAAPSSFVLPDEIALEQEFQSEIQKAALLAQNSKTPQEDETIDPAFLHVQVISELQELSLDANSQTLRKGNVEYLEISEGNTLAGTTPKKDHCRVERGINPSPGILNPYSQSVSFKLFIDDESRSISSQQESPVPSVEITLNEEDYHFRVASFVKFRNSENAQREIWKLRALNRSGHQEVYMEIEVENNQAKSVHITRFQGKDAARQKTCSLSL